MQVQKVQRYGKPRFKVIKGGKAKFPQINPRRPYATHYFTSADDRFASWISNGTCASEQGAMRASVVRIFLGQYGKCQIVDRYTGAVLYTMKRSAHGITTTYGSDVQFKVWPDR